MSQFSVTITGDDTPDVPNTGMLTTGETGGSIEIESLNIIPASVVVAVVSLFLIATLVFIHRKKKSKSPFTIRRKKMCVLGITSVIIIVGVVSILFEKSVHNDIKAALAADGDSRLTITTDDPSINIKIHGESVYAMASNKITVKSSTDAGYVLSAYAEKGDLVSNTNSSDVIPMRTTADLGRLDENSWGVALSEPISQDSVVFRGLSNLANNPTIIKSTNSITEANDVTTVYYGVYVSPDIPQGTYTGTINYVAVANVVEPVVEGYPLTVHYGPGVSDIFINGARIADGNALNIKEGDSVSIDMNAEASSEYKFYNWSATGGVLVSASTKSTTYTMGSKATTLTANAVRPIQNLDDSSCTTSASIVYDKRDGHFYTIQRLKDGNCWMMENLDLGRTALTTDLTSDNTNLAATVTASTFNAWIKASSSLSYNDGDCIPVEGSDSTSGTPYGTLYNYHAASAGTITGSTNSNDAIYDICPAGWRLPTGGSSGEFQALYEKYNSYALMRAPIAEGGAAFALAGQFGNHNPPDDQGSYGFYWASTFASNDSTRTRMGSLYLNGTQSTVSAGAPSSRPLGFAIRCVLK